MSRFENKLCPVCLRRFHKDDDIIVCPICGTPHHRSCYLEKNSCALEEMHGSFEWNGTLPGVYESMALPEDVPSGLPPKDGGNNGSSEDANNIEPVKIIQVFDLPEPIELEQPDVDGEVIKELDKLFEVNIPSEMMSPEAARTVRFMLGSNKRVKNNVSMLELTFFTGTSLTHYLVPYAKFGSSNNGKTGFNLSSGLLMPIYQFFRKMDLLGLALLLLSGLLEAAPVALYRAQVLDAAAAQYLAITARALLTAAMVLLCLFGDYIYYRHAVKTIHKVRRRFKGRTDTVDYYLAIKDKGGVSIVRAVVAILAEIFLMVFIHVFLLQQ